MMRRVLLNLNLVLVTLISFAFLFLSFSLSFAEIPQKMNYQGKLTDKDGRIVPDRFYDMIFSIYDAETGGNLEWTETWDSTTHQVEVTNSIFNVLLGTHTPLDIYFDEDYWLEVQVKYDEVYDTLIPRQQMVSVGYAFMSEKVAEGAITNLSISNTAQIAGAKIEPNFGVQNVVTKGNITATSFNTDISAIELSYLDGVTSPIQPQLDNKISSQWDDVVGGINYADGKVGIGTRGPGEKLTICNGNLKIFNTNLRNGLPQIILDTTNNLSHTGKSFGIINQYDKLSFLNNTDSKRMMTISDNGTVTATAFVGDGSGLSGMSGSGDTHSLDAADGDPTDVVYVNSNGNVGIGTTNPSAKLCVAGKVGIDGNVGIGTTNPGEKLTICNGNLKIFNTDLRNGLPQITLDTTNNPSHTGKSFSIMNQYDKLSFLNNTDSKRMMTISDNGTVTATAFVGDGSGLSGISGMSGSRDTHSLDAADGDPTDVVYVNSDGNVGIGTTGPDKKLTICNGNLRIFNTNLRNGLPQIILDTTNNPSRTGKSFSIMNQYDKLSFLNHTDSKKMMAISDNGTIECSELKLTGGSDIAEPFEVKESDKVIPGMVLVIDPDNPGKLKISDRAYNRCVAGVVSGAGGIKPGLTMMKEDSLEGNHHVALTGRVYALCDASYGSIEPGDLLTTSPTPGYAMKVTDDEEAQGAVLGKAMTELEEGQGLVLVLVTLQ